jgi:hypothetical protein
MVLLLSPSLLAIPLLPYCPERSIHYRSPGRPIIVSFAYPEPEQILQARNLELKGILVQFDFLNNEEPYFGNYSVKLHWIESHVDWD